jgi:hypothetical protein
MEGETDEGGQGFGNVFTVGETPVSSEKEKVRSTTQRRCRTTKPFLSSLRLTIGIARKNMIFPMTFAIADRSRRQTDRSFVRR